MVHGLSAFTRGCRRSALVSMTGRPPPRRAASVEMSELPREARPLRAKSVSLAVRPHSEYGRHIYSADSTRTRFSDKKLFPRQLSLDSKPRRPSAIPGVRPLKRKTIDKIPFAINVQNLSIPAKYADKQKPRHSTSKPSLNSGNRIDGNKTKLSNPTQVYNKRLCETLGGKETENKLLVQISEAEQVSDFERILSSNAILSERQRHVWRGCGALTHSASVVPRPRSAYSLYAVSQTYHYLFQQHEETLQPLIEEYRNARADEPSPQTSLLNQNWCENIHDLTEFYEEDQDLKQEVETITDRIITEEFSESNEPNKRNKYFNVNLADLFGIRVNGEGFSPSRDDNGPSPDVDKPENEEEWRSSMSANSDERHNPQENVDCLAQSLDSVKIDSDATVPTITFSNCCDGRAKSEKPDNTNVDIHLAVPSIDSDEARPPIM